MEVKSKTAPVGSDFFTAEYRLGISDYGEDNNLAKIPGDMFLSTASIGNLGNCTSSGETDKERQSVFNCQSKGIFSSEVPENAYVEMPSVEADYVTTSYTDLRDLLLLSIGAALSLGTTALLTLVVGFQRN